MADKCKNRLVALVLAALMLALPLYCLADEAKAAPELDIECCLLSNEALSVVFHTNMDVSKTKFSAMLDSFELGVSAAPKYEAEGGGTSYLVLADLGGVGEKDIPKLQALAKAAATLVGKNDNIAVMPLGESLNKNPFTSVKSAIDAQLALIKPGEKSDLYSGIAQAAKLFNSTIGVKPARKLIIISNGKNDAALGVTLEEAAKAIEQCGISVCTIGILADKNANSEAINALGSLARRSVGGMALSLDNSQEALAYACEKVRALDDDTYVLHYDLNDIEIENVFSNLLITASATGVELKSDIDVDMRVLLSERRKNAPSPEPTQAPVATPVPAAAATSTQAAVLPSQAPVAGLDADMSKAISDKTVTWAIIDGMAVIGVLILVAAIAKRRKRLADGEDDGFAEGPACYMTLARLTGNRFSYKEAFTSSMTIGRSAREAQLVLLDEETVAPTHCRIDVAGNRLSVISLDNGYDTIVNGEAVSTRQKLLLRQGDVLELGELKLKLRWYMR